MNSKELNEILEKHVKWLNNEIGGERANLCGADLREADLCGADLCGADLYEANLCGADLRWANLRWANLCGAKNISYIPMVCPDTGSFIGWKKATCNGTDNVIVKLEILEDAKRSSATSRKCRCSKAKVLAIETIEGDCLKHINARSKYDQAFIYKVGKTVSVDNFDEDRWNECGNGIHFFINRQEAVEY